MGLYIDLTLRSFTSRARPTCDVNKSRTLPVRAGPERRTVSNNIITVYTVRFTVLTVNGAVVLTLSMTVSVVIISSKIVKGAIVNFFLKNAKC